MRIRIFSSLKECFLLIIFYLLLFQNPLSEWKVLFSYIDEGLALIGPVLYSYRVFDTRKIKLSKSNMNIMAALMVFLIAGLSGNIMYSYQPKSAVVQDVYTNMKFFMAILSGHEILLFCKLKHCRNVFLSQAKIASVGLFALLLCDLMFNVFTSTSTRYGIRVVQLFFEHPTYLASVMVMLVAIFTMFYEKKNILYLVFSLIIMFFTLRVKAIASVLIYALVYMFLIRQRKKLRIWHIALLAAVAIVVAWEQILYYYFDYGDSSARYIMTRIAFVIAKDYFPIGTGFGTYASNIAAEQYSPVYYMYGLSGIYGLTEGNMKFGSDTFWPIIIGQTGVIGTVFFVYVIYLLFKKMTETRKIDIYVYSCGIYIFVYLLISSTSEAAFCNAISIPLAIIIGFIFGFKNTIQPPK